MCCCFEFQNCCTVFPYDFSRVVVVGSLQTFKYCLLVGQTHGWVMYLHTHGLMVLPVSLAMYKPLLMVLPATLGNNNINSVFQSAYFYFLLQTWGPSRIKDLYDLHVGPNLIINYKRQINYIKYKHHLIITIIIQ